MCVVECARRSAPPPPRLAPSTPATENWKRVVWQAARVRGWQQSYHIISCPVDRYITAIRGSESRWTFQLHFILDSTFLVSSTTPRERTTKELKYNKQRRRAALASLPGCADLGPPVTFIIRTYSSNTEQSSVTSIHTGLLPQGTLPSLLISTLLPIPQLTQCCPWYLSIDR